LCSALGDDVLALLGVHLRGTPLSARLIDSVEPDVKTISLEFAPISSAICPRAFSTASSASQP
jgi:hypothetical protein